MDLGTMPKYVYLMAAALHMDMDELSLHLRGLDILGEVTTEGNTVLHIAASRGNNALIQMVLANHHHHRHHQLLSSRNTAGDTPLHCAARAGHHDSVKAMITGGGSQLQQQGMIITARNNAGDNALHSAARQGHHQVVQTLMAVAPSLSYVLNGAGTSALYLAAMSGSLASACAILLPNAKILHAAVMGPDFQNALHAAVLQSDEMAAEVLACMPDLATSTDMTNSTPLHFAAADGSSTIVTRILSAASPAVVAMRDNDGRSALHVAAQSGHADVVRLLVDSCPDAAEIRDYQGKTFLHAACEGSDVHPARICKIVSYVLCTPMLHGLLNAQDNQGNTPLHLLVLKRNNGACVVQKLLSAGELLQVNIMNNDGHTAFDLVKSSSKFLSMVSLVVTLSIHGAGFKAQRHDKVTKWVNPDFTSWRQKISKNLALVSTLIATVAFACMFNVPGSYGGDGKANLDGNKVYTSFLLLDTIAVITSVMATFLLVHGIATSAGSCLSFALSLHCLWVSVLSLFLACIGAMRAVTKERTPSSVQLITVGIGFLIDLLLLFLHCLHLFPP